MTMSTVCVQAQKHPRLPAQLKSTPITNRGLSCATIVVNRGAKIFGQSWRQGLRVEQSCCLGCGIKLSYCTQTFEGLILEKTFKHGRKKHLDVQDTQIIRSTTSKKNQSVVLFSQQSYFHQTKAAIFLERDFLYGKSSTCLYSRLQIAFKSSRY